MSSVNSVFFKLDSRHRVPPNNAVSTHLTGKINLWVRKRLLASVLVAGAKCEFFKMLPAGKA